MVEVVAHHGELLVLLGVELVVAATDIAGARLFALFLALDKGGHVDRVLAVDGAVVGGREHVAVAFVVEETLAGLVDGVEAGGALAKVKVEVEAVVVIGAEPLKEKKG